MPGGRLGKRWVGCSIATRLPPPVRPVGSRPPYDCWRCRGWTRVDAGPFYAFHQGRAIAPQDAINGGVVPDQYFALVERRIAGPIADELTSGWTPAWRTA